MARAAGTVVVPFDPSWTGEQARAAMEALGFTNIQIVDDTAAPGMEPGRIVRTNPAGGQAVQEGASIQIFVQSPSANIPNFAGRVIPDQELNRLSTTFNVTNNWRRPRETNRDPFFVFSQSRHGMTPRGAQLTMEINPSEILRDVILHLPIVGLDRPIFNPQLDRVIGPQQ